MECLVWDSPPCVVIGTLSAPEMLGLLAAASCTGVPRIAVFGGSGFIGSRVVQQLAHAGCEVVSVSRAGRPPAWAAAQPWSDAVDWLSADLMEAVSLPLGHVDCAVSCVGNMRPSPEWHDFFGLHWEDNVMRRENGLLNERIADVARRAGARRFVYVSVASITQYAYGGALMGYIDGKERAEAAVRERFGDGARFVGPTLVYGGDRFAAAGRVLEKVLSSPPVTGYVGAVKAIKNAAATGYLPQDAATEVALSPPAPVELVAAAVCACALDLTERAFVDGSAQIKEVAETARPHALAAAAERMRRGALDSPAEAGGASDGDGEALIEMGAAPPCEVEEYFRYGERVQREVRPQTPSAYGAPFEGALVGFRPLLFPWAPSAALVGTFAAACLTSAQRASEVQASGVAGVVL